MLPSGGWGTSSISVTPAPRASISDSLGVYIENGSCWIGVPIIEKAEDVVSALTTSLSIVPNLFSTAVSLGDE